MVYLATASSEVGCYCALKDFEQEYKQLQALYEAAEHAGRCDLVDRFAVTLTDILTVFQSGSTPAASRFCTSPAMPRARPSPLWHLA